MRKKLVAVMSVILAVLIVIAAGLWYHRMENAKEDMKEELENVSTKEEESMEEEPVLSEEEIRQQKAEEIVDGLTLEEKVAQLFIVTPEALTGVGQVVAAGEATKEAISQYPIGGFIYMSQNLETPSQVKEMVGNVQKYSEERIGLELFISVDEEGGTVTRFGDKSAFSLGKIEPMSTIGATKDTQKAYDVGVQIGTFLNELGFNMDNAPVADVITNPENTVIGSRSFGTDCNLVSEMVLAEMKGLEDQNVIPVIKHYPGHGATEADTHEGYAYTNKTLDEMMENELVPFIDAIEAGAEVIMAAHISCPNITGDDTPTSVSKVMIHDILREQLGYQGIVVTDALNMGAIADEYGSGQAAVLALQAGVDILLMPADFKAAYESVFDAVNTEKITEERIDESVKRIVELKLKYEEDV